jgi:hypothetical protein
MPICHFLINTSLISGWALTIGGSQDFFLDTSYNSVLRWSMAKVTMAIKIDEKVKNKLKELAEKEDRNLSNFVLRAVYIHVKEHHGVDLKK